MNLSYHEKRVSRSLKIMFGKRDLPPLKTLIKIGGEHKSGICKCSVLYSNTDYKIKIVPYNKRKIDKLLLLESPEIIYDLKYSNRSVFLNLMPEDEINTEIIFTRQGFLTDTRYTNIALLKDGQWITPRVPLLKGTQRARLIENRIIHTAQINRKDLNKFSKIRLFNAMMPWGNSIELDISKIRNYD